MIVDILSNIDMYRDLSPDIYAGLVFIREAKEDIEIGIHTINSKVKAVVSEYRTVEHFERGYESHKHVIDIQYPIIGLERVKWSPTNNMEINIPYDNIKDRTFYTNPHPQGTHVIIGNDVFAIFFSNDGHSPQHKVEYVEVIKKITIKVSL